MSSVVRLVPAAALVALLAAGCGGQPTVAAVPADVGPPTDDPSITVVDSRFEPSEIVVTVGTEVQWVWDASIVHDVSGEGFRSDTKNTGTFTHEFTAPGAYGFVCTLHAGMGGTVYVVDA